MESVDIEVLGNVVQWLDDGHRVVLFTVLQTWGSSPRPPGSLLAIRDDGLPSGSVSGGCIEEDLADQVLRGDLPGALPKLIEYGITREEASRVGLPCGGRLQICAEGLESAAQARQLLDAIQSRRVLARRLCLDTGEASLHPVSEDNYLSFDGRNVTRVFGPRWALLIIGAGHLTRYLAQMAGALDYRVVVCEPREDYRDTWDIPDTELDPGMPDDVVRARVTDARWAVLALTHEPKLDDMALLDALQSPAFYVGALGSKTTNDKRRARLRSLDLPRLAVARLHGPVGLPIGSRTPPEIAVAILAEMTAIRRGAMTGTRHVVPVGATHAAADSR